VITVSRNTFVYAPRQKRPRRELIRLRPVDLVPQRSAQADRITRRLRGYRVMLGSGAQYYRDKFGIELADDYQHNPETAQRVIECAEELTAKYRRERAA